VPDTLIAYCGPAAVPDDLWARWNLDPLLIAALAALAFVVGRGRSSNAGAGCGAIALMAVIFVSPLCALASALFSARVFHHVLLVAAVAPLLALAFPLRRAGSPPLSLLVAAHAVILWLWHAPGPYDWGLASVPTYWLMQGSLLGSGWLMWRAIGAGRARGDGRADGASRRADRVCVPAALRSAFRNHVAVGSLSARRPATCRAADVGAGDAALCRRGALARLVEPAAGDTGPLTLLLKFVHLAAIAIWSAGLIVLPFMFRQRRTVDLGWELDRLHRMTRFVYVEIASPAAFVAIASGTALIFLQATFQEWFSTKMVLVAAMAMLHVVAGLVLGRLFLADGRFGRVSYVALSTAYIVLITAIIWIVLAKPHIDSNRFATELFRPGALGQFFGDTRTPTP
jgi:uncharacterized membrane protein